jgi:hypothetical protein
VTHCEALGLPLPILASGHLTTVGASSSESVRDIYVGALDAFPTNAFPPFDYIALGISTARNGGWPGTYPLQRLALAIEF